MSYAAQSWLLMSVVALSACGDSHATCVTHADCQSGALCVAGSCAAPPADANGDFVPTDRDADGVPDGRDNCIDVANPEQVDSDGDGHGDACDRDNDGDGVDDEQDNCPRLANTDQADLDGDGSGDLCDPDRDGDGIDDGHDNCAAVANPSQADQDHDGIGDVCDADRDGDGVGNEQDNCPTVANPDQQDTDHDGVGDACETIPDRDRDGIEDPRDNCPDTPNPEQTDSDLDNHGDACDPPTLRQTGLPWSASCSFTPPVSQFTPMEKWRWPLVTDTISFPTKVQVMSTPMVANLTDDNGDALVNRDDVPDVIFVSFDTTVASGKDPADPTQHNPQGGVLRVVDGASGKTLWSSGGTGQLLAPAASVAVADLDLDGMPEIVALKYQGKGLMAFAADGSVVWDCTTLGACFDTGSLFNWGGVSVADVDQDGSPELLYGAALFTADGTAWPVQGIDGTGDNFVSPTLSRHVGPLSVAVDIDGDGSALELLAGRTVYRLSVAAGAYVRDAAVSDNIGAAIAATVTSYPTTQDGFPAAANVDADSRLELVLVADQHLLLLDDDGSRIDSIAVPQDPVFGTFAGGPPTVGDFDGDGEVEVGVAGESRYAVFDLVGGLLSVLWDRPIVEASSSRTGSSVFDFDADGRAEVVYNDEQFLRIYTYHGGFPPAGYSGCDDRLCTWERPNTSFTAYEYPVIVDVNNDGNAEIVVAANDFGRTDPADLAAGLVPTHGVAVFGDAEDNWVPTRRIWNQHAYHITNIDEDAVVPQLQAPLAGHNSFRKNIQGTAALPDLRAPDAAIESSIIDWKCNSPGAVGVWVENRGALQLPAGVWVTLFAGPPATGTVLGRGQTQGALAPGEAELVVIPVSGSGSGTQDGWAVVDLGPTFGGNNECDETNNAVNLGRFGC